LPIARRFVAVSDGVLAVKDIPGVGCVMSISLPRYAVPT
jgi:signal transduction histidine kinase